VTEREPLWTDEDRAWHLAYYAELAEVCPGCGHPLDECRDPKSAGKWRVVSQRCEACRIGEAEAENAAEAKQRGMFHGVVKG
jgi:hypothetical protein